MLLKKLYSFCCCLLLLQNLLGQPPRLVLPVGHTGWITSALFSPNAKTIITLSEDRTIKLWDAVSGNLLVDDIPGDRPAFSPDGKIIVTILDGIIKIWNSATGLLRANLKDQTSKINSFLFSPDGKDILTSSDDNTAKIWNIETRKVSWSLPNHTGEIWSPQYSRDGKKLVTVSKDSTSKIWDINTRKMLLDLKKHKGEISSPKLSPDGKLFLTISRDSTAKIWDIVTGHLVLSTKIDIDRKEVAKFSPDGKNLLTGDDYSAKLWNINTGKLILDIKVNKEGLLSQSLSNAEFSPDGKKIITRLYDYTKIWDVATGELISSMRGYNSCLVKNLALIASFSDKNKIEVYDMNIDSTITSFDVEADDAFFVDISPDGSKVVSATDLESAKIWNVKDGRLLASLKGHGKQVKSIQIHPGGKKILAILDKGPAKVWDINTGKFYTSLNGHMNTVWAAQFSPDGKKALTNSYDSLVNIYNATNGQLLLNLKEYDEGIWSARFSPDGEKIVTCSSDNTAKIWDVVSGKLVSILIGHTGSVYYSEFSPDGKKVLTASQDSTTKIWDSETGKFLLNLKTLPSNFIRNYPTVREWTSSQTPYAKFSPDGKLVLTVSIYGTVRIWDVLKGNLITDFKLLNRNIEIAKFSPDSKKIITFSSNDNAVKVWDAKIGKMLLQLKDSKNTTFADFSHDGRKIVASSTLGEAKIWDAVTGGLVSDLKGHSNSVNFIQFSIDQSKIITASDDNTMKLWNAKDNSVIATFFSIDSCDDITLVNNGFYQCTTNAGKLLHYVTKNLQVITFEQLDVKYNRPDKVLEAIGNTDTALIKSYHKAWEKRIKKLGIDTTAFRDGYSVPEADFTNRDAIEYEQKDGTLKLVVKGNDSAYKLDRFNVWINEIPVYGQRGISIRQRNKNEYDTTITIKLSQGDNRIETSISNVNGTESYRMPLIVNYTPAVKQKEILRFVGIGIDKFSDNKYNLQYSVKDIRDLSAKLKDKYKDNIIIDTLFNGNVTAGNVKTLKQQLLQTSENDKVIIAYSGHGMLSKEYDYYLSTYSVNFEKPEQDGLPYDELESLLDSIPARKKLMLIDACHSGEVDKEELTTINSTADSMKLKKGIKPVAYKQDEKHLGLKNSFELMQSLFVNVGKSTGATIISAAAGTQFALERGDLKNGVFTYSILEAMNKYPHT